LHVTYTPEDGDAQEWEFDPLRIRSSQAEMIESRFGENWEAWTAGVQSGNMKARRVLLWHLLSREHPTLRYEDVPDFYAGELVVQHSVAELTRLREPIETSNLPADKREIILAAFDREMTDAIAREEARPGKAVLPSSAASGG
jgi:hypothetical protein